MTPRHAAPVIQVFNPFDLEGKSRDCPCLVSLQFILREGVLHSIGHMRSQSALMVMPYDLFLLTMLHEAMAMRLGVGLGCYHHFCGSLHYYEDEAELVDAVLHKYRAAPPEMPPMIPLSPAVKEWIVDAEAAVRRSIEGGHPTSLAPPGGEPDRYWADLLEVMSAGALRRREVHCCGRSGPSATSLSLHITVPESPALRRDSDPAAIGPRQILAADRTVPDSPRLRQPKQPRRELRPIADPIEPVDRGPPLIPRIGEAGNTWSARVAKLTACS